MKKANRPLLTRPAILGFVFFLVPFFYFILWVIIAGQYDTQAKSVAAFQKYLPPSLNGPLESTGLFIVLSLASVVLIANNREQPTKIMTYVTTVVLVLALMLVILLSFSLL